MLGAVGLADGSRVIIEQPFGTDPASARALNRDVHAVSNQSGPCRAGRHSVRVATQITGIR